MYVLSFQKACPSISHPMTPPTSQHVPGRVTMKLAIQGRGDDWFVFFFVAIDHNKAITFIYNILLLYNIIYYILYTNLYEHDQNYFDQPLQLTSKSRNTTTQCCCHFFAYSSGPESQFFRRTTKIWISANSSWKLANSSELQMISGPITPMLWSNKPGQLLCYVCWIYYRGFTYSLLELWSARPLAHMPKLLLRKRNKNPYQDAMLVFVDYHWMVYFICSSQLKTMYLFRFMVYANCSNIAV